jgi:hypothetical protein
MGNNNQCDSTSSDSLSSAKVQNFVSISQLAWTVIVGAAVFFTTLWTTQSVSSTRIDQLEKEIVELKNADQKIENSLSMAENNTKVLLLDISTRLREIEIKMTELQTKLLFAIENKQRQ